MVAQFSTGILAHFSISIYTYKYSFYFLVAKKISDLINENKANGIVQDLCNNLHKEQEANILIFLVYHNGTEKQMEDLLCKPPKKCIL